MKSFKLDYYPDIKNKDILDAVNDGQGHDVLLSTNKINIEYDKRDPRYINRLKDVKIIYRLESQGCLILTGNLGCDYKQPYGGMFFCKRVYIDQNTEYSAIKGVPMNICFTNYPVSNDAMKSILEGLVKDENFEFNLSQFDEFMDIFKFYKQLSSELNNNTTYRIKSVSDNYYYVPVDVKNVEVEESNQITNLNGIVIGYKIEKYKYEMLSYEQQDKVKNLIDIKIEIEKGDDELDKAIKKIK